MQLPIETFPALDRVGCLHGFVGRVPGIELSHDKAVVLENLDKVHRQARQILGLGDRKFITVRQVHGDKIAAGRFCSCRLITVSKVAMG